jgi:transcriptional regulator with XRE-family HTH domain
MYKTADEWESYLGRQIQTLRLQRNMRQQELADRAGVGVITVSRLEGGKGSSLSTLIRVLQILKNESWLEQLAPTASISPIQIHHLGKPRQRAR